MFGFTVCIIINENIYPQGTQNIEEKTGHSDTGTHEHLVSGTQQL